MSDSKNSIPGSVSVVLSHAERVTLSVLDMGVGWLVVDKPENVLTESRSWYPNEVSLVQGLNALMNHPTSSTRFSEYVSGVDRVDVRAVYDLDREISGVGLFVFDEKKVQVLRNAYGSQQLEFVFQFFTRGLTNDSKERVCELPLATHFSEPRMLVSHQTGKKTCTHFRFLENWGPVNLWEARVNYLRWHQIRLHAAEVGLPVIGEDLYASELPLYLSDLKRLKKRPEVEDPLCPGLCLHLSQVSWNAEQVNVDMPNVWEASLRPKMNVMIKKLKEKYE